MRIQNKEFAFILFASIRGSAIPKLPDLGLALAACGSSQEPNWLKLFLQTERPEINKGFP
jgi:hypothetical protein